MDWFVLQLGGSVLALAALGFGLTWWQSVRFEKRWHPPAPAAMQTDRDPAAEQRRPAA